MTNTATTTVRATVAKKPEMSEIYTQHKAMVLAFVMRMGINKDDANDIVGESFRKAIESYENFVVGSCKPQNWVCQIAKNLVIDKARKEKDFNRVGINTAFMLPVNDNKDSLDYGILHNAISTLSDRNKEVLRLRYFEDMKYEEIAVKMDLPLGTVKNILCLSHRELKNILQKVGF